MALSPLAVVSNLATRFVSVSARTRVLELAKRAIAALTRGRAIARMPPIVLAQQEGRVAGAETEPATTRLRFLGRPSTLGDLRVLFATVAEERIEESGDLRLIRDHRRALEQLDGDRDESVIAIDGFGGLFHPAEGWLDYRPLLRSRLPLRATLAEQLDAVPSKRLRQRMKTTAAHGVDWRITRDAADFEAFYDTMYLPLIEARHGEDGHVIPRDVMRRLLRRRGSLLHVHEDGRPVAGAIVYRSSFEPGTMFYWRGGILDALTLPPSRLGERNAALEVGMLLWAIAQRGRAFDFGLVRAVLDDGVLVHKRRLGCDFFAPNPSPSVLLHLPRIGTRDLLRTAPLLCTVDGGLEAHLAVEADELSGDLRALQSRLRDGVFPNLRRITLHTSAPAPNGDDARLGALRRETGAELRVVAAA